MAVGRIGRRNALAEINEMEQVVTGHGVRLAHVEEAVRAYSATGHGEALAGHTVVLEHLAQRMDRQEKLLSDMRNWLIGVLASSAATLLAALYQTLQGAK